MPERKEVMNKKALEKPISEMTDEEFAEEWRRVTAQIRKAAGWDKEERQRAESDAFCEWIEKAGLSGECRNVNAMKRNNMGWKKRECSESDAFWAWWSKPMKQRAMARPQTSLSYVGTYVRSGGAIHQTGW